MRKCLQWFRVKADTLSDLTREQVIQAFSRAAMECTHFPVPALLRDFALIGEPVAVEAKEELFRIVAAMRHSKAEMTLATYAQAVGDEKRDAGGRVATLVMGGEKAA